MTAAFIADIHTRVPTICGTVVKYSSKALTPMATLQPAVGCTEEHTNLKPVELIPQLDLNHFPVPSSLCISCPVVAALPNESASVIWCTPSPHSCARWGGVFAGHYDICNLLVVARLTKEIYISSIGKCPPFICLVQQYPSSILVINISVTIDNSYECVILCMHV